MWQVNKIMAYQEQINLLYILSFAQSIGNIFLSIDVLRWYESCASCTAAAV